MSLQTSPVSIAQNDDALVFDSFQRDLEDYKDLKEVYFPYVGNDGGKTGQVDPGIITTVDMGDRISGNTRTMVLPLRKPAQMGDNHKAEDFGESLDMLALRAFYNSWDKVVNRNDPQVLRIGNLTGREFFNMASTSLKNFTPLQRGDYVRHANVESYSTNITTQADGGPNLTPRYGMNWLVANGAGKPITVTYDSNQATFIANIAAACAAASSTANDYMTVESTNWLNYVSNIDWKIKGLGNEYGQRRILMVGPQSYRYMSSLSSSGSAMFLRKSTYSEKISAMAWQSDIGELPGDVVLVRDDRCPILVYDIPSGTFQIVYYGVDPQVDPRRAFQSDATTKVFEINQVCGQSMLTHGKVIDPTYRDQVKDFSRISQVAVLGSEGWTLSEFDTGLAADNTSTSRVNQAGGVFLTYIP